MNMWEDPSFFDNHRVIEASAGTGKTYTLVNLAAALIEQGKATIEQVLLVTFTEKAVGEIRDRLFVELTRRQAEKPGDNLQLALEGYELASINTFHGFCQGVLTRYAFENRQAGARTLVEDKDVYQHMLRKVQRKDWQEWFGPEFKTCLEHFGFNGESWENACLDLAGKWNYPAGDVLLPDKGPGEGGMDGINKIDPIRDELDGIKKEIIKNIKATGGLDSLFAGMQQLNVKKNMYKVEVIFEKILRPLVNWAQGGTDGNTLDGFLNNCYTPWNAYDRFTRTDKNALLPGENEFNNKGNNLAEVCPELIDIEEAMRTATNLYADFVSHGSAVFIAATVRAIQGYSVQYKIEKGLMSYNDMLAGVWQALSDNKNSPLLAALRSQYHYALVDEFQDTDGLQWNIFRTLFTASENHRLFIIGDPKQAIYRFRGADVNTYFAAKQEITRLNPDCLQTLTQNWRSSVGLLKGLHDFFAKGEWFGGFENLSYSEVTGPDSNPNIGLSRDVTGRAPITVVDCPHKGNALNSARSLFASFMATEIESLLQTSEAGFTSLRIKEGEGFRNLEGSDICILIRGKNELPLLEGALRQKQIGFSFYKQPGIWASEEARHIKYVLKALSQISERSSARAALLTFFFEVTPQMLLQDDVGIEAAQHLLEDWATLAAEQKWGRLFKSLREDSRIKIRLQSDSNWERKLTNVYQITQSLEEAAHNFNLDIQGLSVLLDRKFRGVGDDGEAEYHRLETEDPKVKIMTMHAAKGLEFPVIFTPGIKPPGKDNDGYYQYYRDGHVVYDLQMQDEEGAALHAHEREAENRQLMYVTFTRAQYKLYLPKIRGILPGEALDKAWPESNCDNMVRFVNAEGADLTSQGDYFEEWQPQQLVEEKTSLDSPVKPGNDRAVEIGEKFPEPPYVWDRKLDLSSFTGLSKKGGGDGVSFVEDHEKGDDEGEVADMEALDPSFLSRLSQGTAGINSGQESTTLKTDNDQSPYDLIPKGAETGSMLHEIFEEIDFAYVESIENWAKLLDPGSDSLDVINKKLQKFRFIDSPDQPSELREPIARMVYHTLRTQLNQDDIKLGLVPADDRIHELEFYYPYPNEKGYLGGFIDLIFRAKGKFYVLDWKSNSLDDYGTDSLDKAMEHHQYKLQYNIYTLAVIRWLRQRIPDFDPETQFGGAYYLFLRGMTGGTDGAGVYFDGAVTEEAALKVVTHAL